MLNVALLCVDAGHTDHLHARTEVAAWGHIIIDFHRASFLGQCTDSLLWWHTDVIVVRHHYSSSWNTEMKKKASKTFPLYTLHVFTFSSTANKLQILKMIPMTYVMQIN